MNASYFGAFRKTRERELIRQFLKFCIVGASGVLVNFAIYTLCIEILEVYYILASAISFVIALTCNFFFNKYWTFKFKTKHRDSTILEYGKFTLACIGGYVINLISLYSSVEILGWGKVLSQLISIFFATFFNFLISSVWVFRKIPCASVKSDVEGI